MLDWIGENSVPMTWLAVASVVLFVGYLLALPVVVGRIPYDYFTHRHREHSHDLGVVPRLIKNLVGLVLLAAGIAMLVLPGQGILTILAGLMFLDIPGKRALIARIARTPQVRNSLNWIREKYGRKPFVFDDAEE